MSHKRKRLAKHDLSDSNVQKKQRLGPSTNNTNTCLWYQSLSSYYPHVSTLRDYLILRLPKSSKSRRKKIGSIPIWSSTQTRAVIGPETQDDCHQHLSGDYKVVSTRSANLSKLLDTTIVGYTSDTSDASVSRNHVTIFNDLQQFSQKLHSSVTSSVGDQSVTQSDASYPSKATSLLS